MTRTASVQTHRDNLQMKMMSGEGQETSKSDETGDKKADNGEERQVSVLLVFASFVGTPLWVSQWSQTYLPTTL